MLRTGPFLVSAPSGARRAPAGASSPHDAAARSLRTMASSGRSASSARMASTVWPLARASSHLPSRTRVITV
ncbi:hypothetical protein, partial [Massilia sp. Mn16-1_5]|uniref:hypothetical protein n=1 Tax=Massilia sp. Mn16-1_5 TaxID=2079199 RepID=UPI001B3504BD